MKNLILLVAISIMAGFVSAQAAADKSVQAGLVTGFGLNFQNMGTKLMSANGVGNDLTIGANVNFSFTETIGLTTGLEFDFETLKYAPASDIVYYYYNDTEIRTEGETVNGDQLYHLVERTQKPVYLSIPTMILFRTHFIGYFRYFGKFGLRNSFLLSNKINDIGFNFDLDANPVAEQAAGLTSTENSENMTAGNEMLFFKSSVGLVGGAEWNFTGGTCLVGEIGYYYGFTPLHTNRKEEKEYLFTTDEFGGNFDYFSNKATQGQLMLKLSILF